MFDGWMDGEERVEEMFDLVMHPGACQVTLTAGEKLFPVPAAVDATRV